MSFIDLHNVYFLLRLFQTPIVKLRITSDMLQHAFLYHKYSLVVTGQILISFSYY